MRTRSLKKRPTFMLDLALSPQSLVSQKSRHLKSAALDPVEYVLLLLTGILLGCLVVTVATDVITRILGTPVLWIQEATMIVFVWSIFIGAAVAVRRQEHFAITSSGRPNPRRRLILELINGSVTLAVAVVVSGFGYTYFAQQFHNSLPVTGLPLAVMASALPVFGALLGLFTAERLANGLRNGFIGDDDELNEDDLTELVESDGLQS